MTVQKKSSHKNAARSRQMIKKAFGELLNEKELSKITVTDIVERAGISRGTFYAHYLDAYDLYMALQTNMMEAIDEGINAVGLAQIVKDPTSGITAGISYVASKKNYFKLFVNSSRSVEFLQRTGSYILEKLYSEAETLYTAEEAKMYRIYLKYTLGAIKTVLVEWIDERIDLSTQELITFIVDTYKRGLPEELKKASEKIVLE